MRQAVPPFPRSFRFGVATAALQIEGAASSEGKGASNWDLFARRPGAIFEGHTPEAACEHYYRLEEDLGLLAELGVDSYRFSVSFPRVLPEGFGRVNEKGIAFYDRLIDGLLARGITPYLTLFHWDLPQALEHEGGFRERRIIDHFEAYARLIASRFGDRVKNFLTINEPHAFIEGGLSHGRHAPGFRLPLSEVLRAAHHALLCHGRMTRVLRAEIPGAFITSAPVLITAVPRDDSEANVEAARKYTWEMRSTSLRVSSFWMDPMYLGHYPESAYRQFGRAMPKASDADLAEIKQPQDACGVNLYDAVVVEADERGEPIVLPLPPGAPRTAFNWAISPEAHFYGPKFLAERYKLPVLITENGLSTRDWVHLDGSIPDYDRVDFLNRHLEALSRSIRSGTEILGYMHWSLLDNFEWNHGYRERFGLVHVDFETKERRPKASFFAYKELISAARAAHS